MIFREVTARVAGLVTCDHADMETRAEFQKINMTNTNPPFEVVISS